MKSFSISLFICVCLLSLGHAHSSSPVGTNSNYADRMYLKDKLDIFYIDKPNDTSYTAFHLDNASVQFGNRMDEFWDAANIQGAHNLINALLMEPEQGGDRRLQYMTSRIVEILNKPVRIYLVNDSDSSGVNKYGRSRYGVCPTKKNKAWPCAGNFTIKDDSRIAWYKCKGHKPPKRRDAYAGSMTIGTTYLNQQKKGGYGTFLHELGHTQDFAHWRSHLFYIGKTNYRYGGDDDHYTSEVIPNLAQAYKEGIANAFRLMYDRNKLQDRFNWFKSNGTLLVEKPLHELTSGNSSSDPCSDISSVPALNIWLYDELEFSKVPKAGPNWKPNGDKGPEYARYFIRDLEPRHVIHNEYVIAMIIFSYTEHTGFRKFIKHFRPANEKLRKEGKYGNALGELFHALCSAGLPSGVTLDELIAEQYNRDEAKPWLMPLAFVDFYTSFKAKNEQEFLDMFEQDKRMKKWIQLYWGERTNIEAAMNPNNPQMQDLTTISQLLGVTGRSE